MNHCPLCAEKTLHKFHQDNKRSYLQCSTCKMVSVPTEYHLSPADEKAEYDKHQNTANDPRYRKFLLRAFEPLAAQITKESPGLDFGCGPGPVISSLANERGIMVNNYDLYYFNQPELLEQKYSFVIMTEVIEHIANPGSLFVQLDSILKPAGILAIMTKRVIDQPAFSKWHYKNDPTHICFYSLETFEWIGRNSGWRLEIIDKDVVFFHKE